MTPTHIASNPRLVKEADALHEAGVRVRVVAMQLRPDLAEHDRRLMSTRGWQLHSVDAIRKGGIKGRSRWLLDSVSQKVARVAFDAGVTAPSVVDTAASRYLRRLARAAASQPADVYIAHNLGALPAAAMAAELHGAALGFDAEDLHVGQLADIPENESERSLIAAVESRYLPRCRFLTAASDGIGDELARLYGVQRPRTVLNVFPLAERDATISSAPDRTGTRPSLYWYSQVIGPDRGLDDAVRAIGLLEFPVELHLRGEMLPGYRESLQASVTQAGVADRVFIWPPAPPEELVAIAATHDVGLALEQPATVNRDICVTNKIFTYMLGGLAIAATATTGQQRVMAKAPGAGFTFPPGDAAALAAGLRSLLGSHETLAAARRASLGAARSRYCWDIEKESLLEYYGVDLKSREQLRASSAQGGAPRAASAPSTSGQ